MKTIIFADVGVIILLMQWYGEVTETKTSSMWFYGQSNSID